MPKLWMGGVGTLCAIAHYRAALFWFRYFLRKLQPYVVQIFNIDCGILGAPRLKTVQILTDEQ